MKNLLLPTITEILPPEYRSAHIVLSECNDLSLLTITSEERSAQYRGTFEVSSHIAPRVAWTGFLPKRKDQEDSYEVDRYSYVCRQVKIH